MMKRLIQTSADETLNGILEELLTGWQSILEDNFLGAYLGGSFAHGGWQAYSDVDFNVVILQNPDHHKLEALKALHAGIFTQEHYYARHLEGSFIPAEVLADLDRTDVPVWYLDNGSLNFELSTHDNTLVNRWVLREKGVVLAGPPPSTWIPPVPEERLKAEVWEVMCGWAKDIRTGKSKLDNRFYQAFAVLTYCRMLQTLANGQVQGKPAGAAWAMENLDAQWHPLIEDALSSRPHQHEKVWVPPDPEKLTQTYAFMAYVIEKAPAFWENARR